MFIIAQRDAPTGDATAQWLLGSLYLSGLGVPKDHGAAMNWIEAATRAAISTMPTAISEIDLFAMMQGVPEQSLPQFVQQ